MAALVSVSVVAPANQAAKGTDSEVTALKKIVESLKAELKRDRDTNKERFVKFNNFKKWGNADDDGYGSDTSSSSTGKGKGGKGGKGKGGRGRDGGRSSHSEENPKSEE